MVFLGISAFTLVPQSHGRVTGLLNTCTARVRSNDFQPPVRIAYRAKKGTRLIGMKAVILTMLRA